MRILREMERGVTGLHGEGMYTGKARTTLYVVISRSEVARLKAIIHEIDRRRLSSSASE